MNDQFLILGCGFTGRRLAERLLNRGASVVATTRDTGKLAVLESRGASVLKLETSDSESLGSLSGALSPGLRVLISIPPIEPDVTRDLLNALGNMPSRLVYLSTTGVYGEAPMVDETTPAAPASPSAQLRISAEQAVQAGVCPALVLRPAAIYGPGRGVHASMRAGTFRLAGKGENFVSRIHVEDLAAHAEAALLANITGAYPVADEEPCRSREIAEFCAALLGVPMPLAALPSELHETRGADRRVNGSAIRRLLGINLKYPSYRTGIPASIREEQNAGLE